MQDDKIKRLIEYLIKYGYIQAYEIFESTHTETEGSTKTFHEVSILEFQEALVKFKKNVGLPADNNISKEVLEKMKIPRCGFPYIPESKLNLESLSFGKWSRTNLSYRFDSETNQIGHVQLRRAISRALKLWEDVTPFNFYEVDFGGEHPDIIIKFETNEHGDGSQNRFDGQGGELAHAFSPFENMGDIVGDVHFDDSEDWVLEMADDQNRIDLITVAAHEFGHSLGLAHTETKGALMNELYIGEHRWLHQEDIDRIQRIYGSG